MVSKAKGEMMKKKKLLKLINKGVLCLENKGMELYSQNYMQGEKLQKMHRQLINVYDHQAQIFAELLDRLETIEKRMNKGNK